MSQYCLSARQGNQMLEKTGFAVRFMAIAGFLLLAGCQEPGQVEQGRVVAFDPEKRQVSIIHDTRGDAAHPEYTQLPPITYTLPDDPQDTGPLPRAGRRMKLDIEKQQIVYFDPDSVAFKTIDYEKIERRTGVGPNDPLVKGKKFPQLDSETKTLTLYSSRQKILETLRLPETAQALPGVTWEAGDEVRIYYREAGKALRFMNITQTDIFKK